jgi:CheY-like chemotaxis protein
MRDRTPRILLVDDQPDMLRTLGRLLRVDAEVSTAGSGLEALEIIRQGARFDLVLCDIMMPGMTGLELFDRVRSLDAAVADTFVFTTGGIGPEQQARLDATGMRCLTKPCDLGELRRLATGEEPIVPPRG